MHNNYIPFTNRIALTMQLWRMCNDPEICPESIYVEDVTMVKCGFFTLKLQLKGDNGFYLFCEIKWNLTTLKLKFSFRLSVHV